MIIYKRTDATAYFGWDFSAELPTGYTLDPSNADVKIFDSSGADVTTSLRQQKIVGSTTIDVIVKKGGTVLTDYTVKFIGVTTPAGLEPVHEVTMKVRDSG